MPEHFADTAEDDGFGGAARARHAIALGASVFAHALAALAIVFLAPRIEHPHTQWVLAYIVELGGNGGAAPKGNGGEAKSPPASGPIASAKTVSAQPAVQKKTRLHRRPIAPRMADIPQSTQQRLAPVPRNDNRPISRGAITSTVNPAMQSGGAGGTSAHSNRGIPDGRAGANGNGGEGNGNGAGTSSARAAYGQNPPPPYPLAARRRAQQGTVTLRVLVAIDGSVKQVDLLDSSGVDALDDSAMETVRSQWRFIPARRDGAAIESWVVIPIRFTLTDMSSD